MSNELVKRTHSFTPDEMAAATQGGFVSRLTAAVRFALTGVTPTTWMSPSQPQAPQHQDVAGRQFDYPVGSNLNTKPRASEPIDFPTLRMLADGYDLMRLIIETRKDQLCKMKWKIVGKDDEQDVEKDSRVKQLHELLAMPDRRHSWQTWLRMLLEDHLVIDAATVYPRKNLAGGLYSLDIVDGATIKVVIDQDGRRPTAPQPAYQQIIKGLPAVDYSEDELLYMPRNKRSWKLYGQSPVEQVVMTVNIALRRQVHQLQYYTEGNIPEALINVPEDWKPDQIKQMQNIWDSLLEGNTAQRRHAKFIPGAQKITFTKDMALKDEYDEWLARIVCFAFSVSPTPFVKQTNRATAETAQEAALEEGLAPLMTWVQDFMDMIIAKYFGWEDLKFAWDESKELDPKTQAEIHKIYIDAGVFDVDEVRNALGFAPRGADEQSSGDASGNAGDPAAEEGADPAITVAGSDSSIPSGAAPGVQSGDTSVQDTAMNGAQVTALVALVDEVAAGNLPAATARAVIAAAFPAVKPELIDEMLAGLENFEQPVPEPPVVVAAGATPGGAPAPKAGDAAPAAGAKVPPPKGADAKKAAPRLSAETAKLTKALNKVLMKTGKSVARQVTEHRDDVAKAGGKPRAPVTPIEAINLTGLYTAEEALSSAIEGVTIGAAADSIAEVGVDKSSLVNLANSRAERWAAKRAGELIATDANGGELVSATRELIKGTIMQAEHEGWSNAKLKSALEEHYAFSPERAETIARTELKSADAAGNMIGYRSSGVVSGKEWSTSEGDACEDCVGNEDAGVVPLDDDFPSGDDTVPAHPNCNCSVTPVLSDEGDNADTTEEE